MQSRSVAQVIVCEDEHASQVLFYDEKNLYKIRDTHTVYCTVPGSQTYACVRVLSVQVLRIASN